jgi:hypothetical protein
MGNSLIGWINAIKTAALAATSAEPALPVSNIANDQGNASTGWQTLSGALAPVLTITPLARTLIRAVGVFRTNLSAAASMVVNLYQQALDTTLDLSFLTGTLDPRIVFARASTATYFDVTGTLRTALANIPRFEFDPITHVIRGFLLEDARTNSLLQSNGFTSWTGVAATGTANAALAPDGTTTATQITEDTSASTHFWNQVATINVNQAISFSLYVKDNTRRWLNISLFDNTTPANSVSCDFDLTLGTKGTPGLGGVATAASSTITPVGNGWFRVSLTVTLSATATSGAICRVRLENAAGVLNYTGDGVSSLFIWGLQVEAGATVSSLIPTTTAAATRAVDNASIPTTGWLTASGPGTIQAEAIAGVLPAFTNYGLVLIDDGSNNNKIQIWSQSGQSNVLTQAVAAGVTSIARSRAAVTGGTVSAAAAWDGTNLTSAFSGVAQTVAPSALPTGLSRMFIGRINSAVQWTTNGHLRRIRYWPRALSSAELVSATDPAAGLVGTATVTPVNGQAVAVLPADVGADYITVALSDPANPDNHINVPLAYAGTCWQPTNAIAWASSMGRDEISDTVTSRGGQTYVALRASFRRWEISLDGIRTSEAYTQLDTLDRFSRAGSNALLIPNISNGFVQQEATFGIIKATADVTFPLGVDSRRSWRARITERL